MISLVVLSLDFQYQRVSRTLSIFMVRAKSNFLISIVTSAVWHSLFFLSYDQIRSDRRINRVKTELFLSRFLRNRPDKTRPTGTHDAIRPDSRTHYRKPWLTILCSVVSTVSANKRHLTPIDWKRLLSFVQRTKILNLTHQRVLKAHPTISIPTRRDYLADPTH